MAIRKSTRTRTITRTTPYHELPQWMSVEEFSDYTGTTPWTTYQHIHEGLIPYRRLGKRILIPRDFLTPDKAQAQVTAAS